MNGQRIDTFPAIQDALQEFQVLTGMILRGNDREQVAALIEKNGCTRSFVAELAEEVEAERLRRL